MKAMMKRTKGLIWRTILGLPFSVLLLGVIYILQSLLKVFDFTGVKILAQWHKVEDNIKTASRMGRIAWFILYLPFMILSILGFILIMYPIWYVVKPIADKLCSLNINLLLWIEYRAPLPEEEGLIQQSVETLKTKLKEQGATDKELATMFDEK